MKSMLAVLAVLAAAVALAQAGPVLDGDNKVSLMPVASADVTALSGKTSKLGCYLTVVGRLVAFVADIPRNCLDLAWRSGAQFLYVLPTCVIYSGAATYQLGTILFPTCA